MSRAYEDTYFQKHKWLASIHEQGVRILRVESEDGLLVAPDEEEGRHALTDVVQPGHVQGRGHVAFARHRQGPGRMKFTIKYKKQRL